LEHGPESDHRVACQYGMSGACEEGRHKDCAHNPGGWQHAGCARAEDSLRHKVDGYWFAVMDSDGKPVPLLPLHVWRCSCSHHLEHRVEEAAR
jgi:hypothetical protein